MRINFVFSHCYQNFKGENAMISGSKLKRSNLRRIPATNSGRNSGESNIANLWKYHFSAISNFFGSTDNRDQFMNALRGVPDHNVVINVYELRQIVRLLKI